MYTRALISALALSTPVFSLVLEREAYSTAPAACGNGTTAAPTPTGPCAVVASVSASYLSAYPSETAAVVPASLASACLNSVPIDPQVDVALIDYLIPFAQLQSTIGFLAKPPEEYLLPGIDVLGGLDEIKSNLFEGYYENQFQFVSDVQKLYWRTFDGHFGFVPILLAVFTFQPGSTLVSVSEDGLQIPGIYLGNDLSKAVEQNYTPSAIESIDGEDVETWAEVTSQVLRSQDPDSLYNQLFFNIAGAAASSANAFRQGSPFLSLPDSFAVTFANGSTTTVVNSALVNANFEGITSGELLHQVYEIPKPTSSSSASSTASATTASSSAPASTSLPPAAPTAPGYPYPVPDAKHYYDYLSGYFLNESEYSDTAVLSVYSFAGEGANVNSTFDFFEFRRVANTFFDACRAANKTRLVVDLSGNGGGNVMLGYELYKHIFPESEIWDGIRVRGSELLNFAGNATFPDISGIFPAVLDEEEKQFETWQDLFGPEAIYDDYFTNILRNNFSQIGAFGGGTTINTTVTGYGDVPAPAQPFAAENIVIVTDGICASTCTVFAELMTRQDGVRTIAMGGRPIEKPMQAIGGVKGAQVVEYADLTTLIENVVQYTGGYIPYGLPIPDTLTSPITYSSARLNWKNAYAINDTDTPLQFVYEAANCKRFFRTENLFDITTVWTDAVDVAWGEASCVQGSTVSDEGKISGDALPYSEDVRPTVPFAAVPGSPSTEVAESGSNCTASSGTTAEKRSLRMVPRTFKPVDTDIEPQWINLPKPRFGTS